MGGATEGDPTVDTSPHAIRQWLVVVQTVAAAEGNHNLVAMADAAEHLVRETTEVRRAVDALLHTYSRTDRRGVPVTIRAALDQLADAATVRT